MTVLRNGADVPESIATTTMLALELLMKENPVALYEAIQLARDSSHIPFGNTGKALAELGLVNRVGEMRRVTRDVILAAAEADETSVRLMSPYAAEGPA